MSGSIRLFVDAPLRQGAEHDATAAQAHYLGTVMRRSAGDRVNLFNGLEGEWEAEILAIRRDRLRLRVLHLVRPQASEPNIWLVFAPVKRDATELVVQKATELGVSALVPVLTQRSNIIRFNDERLRAIAIEAAEQSERLSIPRIDRPIRLLELLSAWPVDRTLVAALERSTFPPPLHQGGPLGLLIGPEGGFTCPELDALRRHAFVVPASLGPRILRAETAAIAGLALLLIPAGG